MLIVTTNEIPGFRILAAQGELPGAGGGLGRVGGVGGQRGDLGQQQVGVVVAAGFGEP